MLAARHKLQMADICCRKVANLVVDAKTLWDRAVVLFPHIAVE
jgi:hypothetical protein